MIYLFFRFQSTPSVWRETKMCFVSHQYNGISIHSLRMEGDLLDWDVLIWSAYFNPLPPYGGRPGIDNNSSAGTIISIHSLRMEGDMYQKKSRMQSRKISIHSLRMEGDLEHLTHSFSLRIFQSTPSVWRETYMRLGDSFIDSAFQSTPSVWRETKQLTWLVRKFCWYFNPLPPYGGRLG